MPQSQFFRSACRPCALIIARRELMSLFYSPIALTVLLAFVLVNGYNVAQFLVREAAGAAVSVSVFLTVFLDISNMLLLFIIPPLTMKTFAEERRQGTMESLMTAPVSDAAVVFGKFLGVLGFYVFLWATTLPYLVILGRYTAIEPGPVISLYAGMTMLGAAYIALGIFASSLTRDQIVALILTLVAVVLTLRIPAELNAYRALLLQGGLLEQAASIERALETIYISEHMVNSTMGIVSTRSVVFFASVTFVFLFLTVKVIESRKWMGSAASTGSDSSFRRLTLYGGIVGLVLAAVAVAWALLIAFPMGLSAALFAEHLFRGVPAALLAIGAGLALLSVVSNLRFFGSLVVAGRGLMLGNVAVQVAALLALAVFANLLGYRHRHQFDLTGMGVYTLSGQTRQRVEALGIAAPVTLHLIWTHQSDYPIGGLQEYTMLRRLLGQFDELSPRIRLEEIDKNVQPRRIDELMAQTGLGEQELQDRCLLVTSGDRHTVLWLDNLFEYDASRVNPQTGLPLPAAFTGEAALAGALIQITTTPALVCFVADGGAEVPEEPRAAMPMLGIQGRPGRLRRMSAIMNTENYTSRVVQLDRQPIPPNTDVLALIGPKSELSERALQQIDDYLNDGARDAGALFAVGHERAGGPLAGLLESAGLRITSRAVQPTAASGGRRVPDRRSVLLTQPQPHPITGKIIAQNDDPANPDPQLSAKMIAGAVIETLPDAGGWSPSAVLTNYSPASAWLASEEGGPFDPGPFVLMGASERTVGRTGAPQANGPDGGDASQERPEQSLATRRLVLIGDPLTLNDALMNDVINYALVSNTLNWLAGRDRLIAGIGPKRIGYLEMDLTDAQRRNAILIVVVFMPAAVLLAGGGLWWIRRR